MKKNTWNNTRLVDETIVPSTQSIILKIVRFLGRTKYFLLFHKGI